MSLRSQFGGVAVGPHTGDLSIFIEAEDIGGIVSVQRHDATDVTTAHYVDVGVGSGSDFFGRGHSWTPVFYATCRTICTIPITPGRGNELR